MISLKLIEGYKKEYKEVTGRDLGEDIYLSSPRFSVEDEEYWLKVVLSYFNLSEEDLVKRSTLRKFANPRIWYYYLCTKNNVPHTRIANRVNRERSNVSQLARKRSIAVSKSNRLKQVELQLINHKI